MITTAAGYRFTLPPFSPSRTEITGGIIPVTDGTASVGVPRMENIAYLTEMAREIGYWADPAPYTAANPNYITNYNRDDRRLERYVLGEIARCAKNDFGVRGEAELKGYSGVIPVEWALPSGMSYPIVKVGAGAIDSLIETMSLARCSTGVIPVITETDTLRRAFYDFGQMRRFLMRFLSPGGTNLRWADYARAMADGNAVQYHHMTGPMVQGDGGTTVTENGATTTVDGYVSPSFSQEWRGGSVNYTKSISNSLCAVVDIYYYRPGLTTGTPYLANTLNGWASFTAEARTNDGVGTLLSVVVPTTFTLASVITSRASPFYGLGQAIYNTPIGGEMAQHFAALNSWCGNNIPNWSTKRESLAIGSMRLQADSGVLSLPSEIASAGWGWTP